MLKNSVASVREDQPHTYIEYRPSLGSLVQAQRFVVREKRQWKSRCSFGWFGQLKLSLVEVIIF